MTAVFLPFKTPRSQWREAFRTTGPLTPKCVHNNEPSRRSAIAPSIQIESETSCDTPDRSGRALFGEDERCKCGSRRHDTVTERRRHRVAPAVAASLRKGPTAGGENHAAGVHGPGSGFELKGVRVTRDTGDPASGQELSPAALQLAQQRLRDVARAVGDGEHLAARLFF